MGWRVQRCSNASTSTNDTGESTTFIEIETDLLWWSNGKLFNELLIRFLILVSVSSVSSFPFVD